MRLLTIIGVTMCLLFVTASGYRSAQRSAEAEQEIEFGLTTSADFSRITSQLVSQREAVNAIASLFSVSEDVTRQQFRDFVTPILKANPTIKALEWIPRVPPEQRPAYEKDSQNNGYPAAVFKQLDIRDGNHVWVPAAEDWKPEAHFPVYYMEPLRGNEGAYCIDLRSDTVRYDTMLASARSNEPISTAPVKLAQTDQTGVLLFVPVYKDAHPPADAEQRLAQLRGFACGVFDIEHLIHSLRTPTESLQLNLRIADVSIDDGPLELFETASFPQDPPDASVRVFDTSFAGREWRFEYVSPPQRSRFVSASTASWVLVSGLFGTTAIAAFLWSLTRQTAVVEQVVQQRTRELTESNHRLNEEIRTREATQDSLSAALAIAESANRAKGDFVANVSHEIRTPLNALLGITELVLQSDLDFQQRSYLETVLDSGHRLLSVINDVLDFSKIEAGKLELQTDKFALRVCVAETLRTFQQTALSKGLELSYEVQADVPEIVVGDSQRLRQVLINLVGNALKFTNNGGVRASVRRDTNKSGQTVLHFKVADTGVGIPADKLKSVFEAFEQVDNSSTRQYEGTGLGLAITSRLVQAMGGRIWVESQPGRGSNFHFTVVFGTRTAATDSTTEYPELREVPVLIIDEDLGTRLVLKGFLEFWGTSVYPVAYEAMARHVLDDVLKDRGKPPVVILNVTSDDGPEFSLLESLVASGKITADHVIVLSESPSPEIHRRCQAFGSHYLLRKPVKQTELLESLIAIVVGPEFLPTLRPAESDNDLRQQSNLRVLVAEDGKANQILAQGLLERWGHRVTIVETGEEAVNVWRTNDFDLILMDVQMPIMSGLDATEKIRELEAEQQNGPHIPIIAMTARAMADDRDLCLRAGMDEYISKPINSKLLGELIARFFPLKVLH